MKTRMDIDIFISDTNGSEVMRVLKIVIKIQITWLTYTLHVHVCPQ